MAPERNSSASSGQGQARGVPSQDDSNSQDLAHANLSDDLSSEAWTHSDPLPAASFDINAVLSLPAFHRANQLFTGHPSELDSQTVQWPESLWASAQAEADNEAERHWSVEQMRWAERAEQKEDEVEEQDKAEGRAPAREREDTGGTADAARMDTGEDEIMQDASQLPAVSQNRRILDFGPHWELVSGPLPHSADIIKHYLAARKPVDTERLREFIDHVNTSMPNNEAFQSFVSTLRLWLSRQITYEALIDWLVYFFSAKPDLLERSNILLGTIAKLTSKVLPEKENRSGDTANTRSSSTPSGLSPFDSARPTSRTDTQNSTPASGASPLSPPKQNSRTRASPGSVAANARTLPQDETRHTERRQTEMAWAVEGAASKVEEKEKRGEDRRASSRSGEASGSGSGNKPRPPLEIDVVYSCPLGVYRRKITLDG